MIGRKSESEYRRKKSPGFGAVGSLLNIKFLLTGEYELKLVAVYLCVCCFLVITWVLFIDLANILTYNHNICINARN